MGWWRELRVSALTVGLEVTLSAGFFKVLKPKPCPRLMVWLFDSQIAQVCSFGNVHVCLLLESGFCAIS